MNDLFQPWPAGTDQLLARQTMAAAHAVLQQAMELVCCHGDSVAWTLLQQAADGVDGIATGTWDPRYSDGHLADDLNWLCAQVIGAKSSPDADMRAAGTMNAGLAMLAKTYTFTSHKPPGFVTRALETCESRVTSVGGRSEPATVTLAVKDFLQLAIDAYGEAAVDAAILSRVSLRETTPA